MDDEWPEEDVKPKKGKKGKKGKKAQDDDDEEPVADAPVNETPQPETAVNIDDEWPEEDVKPKKGKKGKKGKKAQQDDDEDDWFVKQDEKKEETKEDVEKEAKPEVKQAAPAAAEPEADADEEDDGPKVSMRVAHVLTADLDKSAKGKAQEREGEGEIGSRRTLTTGEEKGSSSSEEGARCGTDSQRSRITGSRSHR